MAVKKRVVGGTPEGKKTTTRKRGKKKVSVELPTELSAPLQDPGDYAILLYGEEKIGKTSLASKFPDAFFLMFEPGGKALAIYQKPVTSWDEFLAYLDLLEAGDHEFGTVVLDVVDLAYGYCMDYVCKQLVITHPSEEDYGKGWKAVRDEFTKAMLRLLRLRFGSVFLSHATEKEIKRRNGEESHRIVPTMPKQAREVLEGLVDIIAYYHFDDNSQRVLMVEGDDLVSAGSRLEHAFQKTKTIPMGSTANEAYKNFVAAYNNKIVEPDAPDAVSEVKKPVRRKKKK